MYLYIMGIIIMREKAHFRIEIRDLSTGKTKTISIGNHNKFTLEDIKTRIIGCFQKV